MNEPSPQRRQRLLIASASLLVLAGLALLSAGLWRAGRGVRAGDVAVVGSVGVVHVLQTATQTRASGLVERGFFVSDLFGHRRWFVREAALARPVSAERARAMLALVLRPTRAAPAEPSRVERSLQLWDSGTREEQARYLGELLAIAPGDEPTRARVLTLVTGFHHILKEIAFVLGIPHDSMRRKVEERFPWLVGNWLF